MQVDPILFLRPGAPTNPEQVHTIGSGVGSCDLHSAEGSLKRVIPVGISSRPENKIRLFFSLLDAERFMTPISLYSCTSALSMRPSRAHVIQHHRMHPDRHAREGTSHISLSVRQSRGAEAGSNN